MILVGFQSGIFLFQKHGRKPGEEERGRGGSGFLDIINGLSSVGCNSGGDKGQPGVGTEL